MLPFAKSEIDLLIVNNPGYNLGLIGAGIAEAHRLPKRNWLRRQVASDGFDHLEVFRARFTEAMQARGYRLQWPEPLVVVKNVKVPRATLGLRKSYRPVSSDAQMDIGFGFIGYAAAGTQDSAPYRPTVVAAAKLISADGKNPLFTEVVNYNEVFGFYEGKAIVLQPDDAFRYPDFDDLEAAGPTAVSGLKAAFEATADKLAEQFGPVQ